MLLVFVGALLDAPGATARAALFPDVVELADVRMERASGIRSGIQQGAQLLGAPLGGVLVAAFGATAALWLDAASFLVSAGLVLAPRPAPAPRRSRRGAAVASSRSSPRGCASSGAARSSARSSLMVLLTNLIEAPRVGRPRRLRARGVRAARRTSASSSASSAARRSRALSATARSGTGCHAGRRSSCASPACRSATSPSRPSRRSPSRSPRSRSAGLAAGPINPLLFTVQTEIVPAALRGRVFGADSSRLPGPRSHSGSSSAASLVAAIGAPATFLVMGVLLGRGRRLRILQPDVPRDGLAVFSERATAGSRLRPRRPAGSSIPRISRTVGAMSRRCASARPLASMPGPATT